ncbi:MAG: tetratricopeptide repeat protein, partial [Clostridia bacterium]|nr:tetratricopeptide repeat protein [Clostridia bacterium]
RIRPDYTPSSELLASVLSNEEKYEEAINVYKNAIRYDEENYELYHKMGLVYSQMSNFDDAEFCYKKAIYINPTMYASYFALGQNYLLNNDLDKAESMFKKAIPGSDTMAKSYYQIAKIGMLRNNQTKAINNLESAIEVDSSYRQKAMEEPIFNGIRDTPYRAAGEHPQVMPPYIIATIKFASALRCQN